MLCGGGFSEVWKVLVLSRSWYRGPREPSVPAALILLSEFRGCVRFVPDTRNRLVFCSTSQTCCLALALALSGML